MELVIVDDEIASLNTFLNNIVDNKYLSYRMYKNDPFEVLNYMRSKVVAAAFLDINMPEIDGVTLAKKMIEIDPNIKIVFISGYAQNEEEIKRELGSNLMGFCYKPYDEAEISYFIALITKNANQRIRVQAFPTFEVYNNDRRIEFKRKKCKELLALLVDRRGGMVTMGDAIACLWPDKDVTLSKRLYRDAVIRLRFLLQEYGLSHLVKFSRGTLNLDSNFVECDLWDFMDGKNKENYFGEYMVNYEWSIEKQTYLDDLLEKRKNGGCKEINF